ncbi:hypothetical protein N7468_003617 [Penicillium chermesinum]|uniref:Nudix hydrolase domain-containing protein n=1 Tax=Penicillium chermesinum TaxID=63820 RepID=A0A9W9P6V6_9EURO|nr:uncharacterized protein N7468_003617 [Penicillium chermesinum]KAJ5238998.1 hypothetical protein N7468_003617 [Penicillium chermesinum]KAJ6164641.1 hypothetical protein N7470_003313 [Penicillium chermesinum]
MEFPYTVAPHLDYFSIPRAEFIARRPEFDSFAVGGYVFSQDGPLDGPATRRILLLQRALTDSMLGCWEGPGGASESDDQTLLDGVVREVLEETGLHVSKVVELVGVDSWTHTRRLDGVKFRIAKYSFIVEVYEAFQQPLERIPVPVATEEIPVRLEATEHQAFEWATEQEVRDSAQTGQGKYKLSLPSMGPQGANILRSFEMIRARDTN